MPGFILDIGCGSGKAAGAVGLDLKPRPGVDLVADAGRGLPFEAASFDLVRLSHIVEHVSDVVGLMREAHRVLAPGGRMYILTPHFSAAASYLDPTHAHHFSLFSFDVFCGLAKEDFVPLDFRFNLKGRRLIFGRKGRLGLGAWANRHPQTYEQHLAFLLPALEIEVTMEKPK